MLCVVGLLGNDLREDVCNVVHEREREREQVFIDIEVGGILCVFDVKS